MSLNPDLASRARATALAELEELGLRLPTPVTQALKRRRVVQAHRLAALAGPGVAANQAQERAAFAVAQATGTEIDLDTTGITLARVAEAEARDRAALLSSSRQACDITVCQIVDRHAATVVQTLQNRYTEIAANFVPAVRRLPADLTVNVALQLGASVREDWLLIEDGVAELGRLRELVAEVGDTRERTVPDARTQAARWCRSPFVYQALTPHSRTGTSSLGPAGSREFLSNLAREVDASDWWCPTLSEVRSYFASDPWAEKAGARG